jgi:hypothetical protein
MASMPSIKPRSGLVIVRVWLEPGASGIRARVTEIEDLQAAVETVRASADADEIAAWVKAFVARFGVTSA